MKARKTAINDPVMTDDRLGISHYALTGTGDRSRNEDSHGHAFANGVATFVVSDGVGGYEGGEHASRLVVETTRSNARSMDRSDLLRNYEQIGHEIERRQQQDPRFWAMSATICELRVDTARQLAIWGHLGDSRVYWIRDGRILGVTRDHSAVKSLVDAGLITLEEAARHPQRSTLLGALGAASAVSAEVLQEPVGITDGDAFLLCTDGFWSLVPENLMCESLRRSTDVKSWVGTLAQHASTVRADDKDNYTAIGVWITQPELKTVL